MQHSVPVEDMTTDGGLLVLAVLVPFVAVLAGLVLGGRHAQRVALATLLPGLGLAIAIADALVRSGRYFSLSSGWLGTAVRRRAPRRRARRCDARDNCGGDLRHRGLCAG